MGDRCEACRDLGGTTCNARRAEKHHAARRLIGKTLEKAVDDEPPEAVADKVNLGRGELAYKLRKARRDAAHGCRCSRVAKRIERQSKIVRQAVAEDERLLPGHPQAMYVDNRGHGGGRSVPQVCGARTRTC